jgi:polysaccharide biosynthesis protein PslE
MSTQSADPTSTLNFLKAIFRHLWLMLGVAVLVMGGFVAYNYYTPRVYRSQAKVYIGLGRQNTALDPTTALDSAPPITTVSPNRESEMNSIIEILNSRDMLTQVVDAIGPQAILGRPGTTAELSTEPEDKTSVNDDKTRLGRDSGRAPPDPGEQMDDRYRAVLALMKSLEFEVVRKSDILLITYDGPEPEVARRVANKVVDLFLVRYTELNRTSGSSTFIAEQSARMRKDLDDAEDKLRELRVEGEFGSADGQRLILETRIGRLEDELLKTTSEALAAKAEIADLRKKLEGLAKTQVTGTTKGIPNTGLDTMRLRLFELQLKLTDLKARKSEKDPEVKITQEQINEATQMIDREEKAHEQITTGPNRMYEELILALVKLEPRLRSLEAQEKGLITQLKGERAKLKGFADYQLKVNRAQRDLELQDAYYRKSKVALQMAEIDNELNARKISNLKVVQRPTFDIRPIRPRTLVNLGTGAAVAVLAAIGAVLLLEYTRSKQC